MKRFKNILVFLVIAAIFMVAFTPFPAVTLSDDLQQLLAGFVAVLVTGLVKWLGGLLKVDLSDWGAILTAAVVSVIVAFVNMLLSGIPAPFEELADLLQRMLIILLSSMGFFSLYKHSIKNRLKN